MGDRGRDGGSMLRCDNFVKWRKVGGMGLVRWGDGRKVGGIVGV